MDNVRKQNGDRNQLLAKPPLIIPNKFNFNKPKQNFKLRNRIGVAELQKCGVHPFSSNNNDELQNCGIRLISSNCSSVNSSIACPQDELSSTELNESRLHKTANANIFNSTIQPLKPPKIPDDDILEHEFTKYLHDELIAACLEEEEDFAKDIMADEDIVAGIYQHFRTREAGMTVCKNDILYRKMNDIAAYERLYNCLSTVANISNSDTDSSLAELSTRLSEALDTLPIVNCTFNNETQAFDWVQLESMARKLCTVLNSPEKPFPHVKTLKQSIANVMEELERIDLKQRNKSILNQKLTFLTSLRLCSEVYEKNALKMGEEYLTQPTEVVSVMEELEDENGIDNESMLICLDDSFV